MKSPSIRLQLMALAMVVTSPGLGGCRAPISKEEPTQPFVFRSLNLRQKDASGRPLWELSSPEARYDLGRRVAQARDLRGVVYARGVASYRISATSGTVLNDGEIVQLEGPTLLQRIGPKPLVVTATRVRWYPRQERMEIDRTVRASQGELRLTAARARFWIQQDKLELRGRPVLQRPGENHLKLTLRAVDWFPTTGQLLGRGPVRGQRSLPANGLQTLTSPALSGNSLTQIIDLQSPVQLLDPARKARIDALETRIQLAEERISSPHPFRAWLDQSKLTGIGFELLGPSHTVVIPRSCRLNQPTDSLSADRCTWNWQTNRVEASGGVVLRRKAYEQVTRAQRLTGVVSKQGQAVFSNPGSRVETRMTLPQSRPQSRPRDRKAERKAPPFSL